MNITIVCRGFDEAITALQEAKDDKQLTEEIEKTEEGELIYTPWGDIIL